VISKNPLKQIWLPLVLLGLCFSILLIWRVFDLPTQEEMVRIARLYFEKYGLITLFISSIIEGILVLGWYYPGSLVIFLGVIFAGKDIPKVIEAVAIITAGLLIAYIIDFFMGKYGWYRLLLKFGLRKPIDVAKQRLEKRGMTAIYASFWDPNLAGLTSTAAGILQFTFKKVFKHFLLALIIWNIFWGTLVYFLGEAALSVVGIQFTIVAITA
jgi:membrane-associated protein